MIDVRIDPEFQSLIPPLTPEEKAGLEASIIRHGCRDPLSVWMGEGILLDGHHRFEICSRLSVPYKITPIQVDTRADALAWAIRNQFGRRNLSPLQKIELAMKLEEALRPAAEARMLAGRADPTQTFGQGTVTEQIAAVAGVSDETIRKARYLMERARPAVLESLRTGETTISAEYTRMKTPGRTHSSASNEWYTPSRYVKVARRVLEDIDLDPTSYAKANETVRAARYYDEQTDGLVQEWPGRVWLNPPYSGMAGLFAGRLIDQYSAGITQAAVILVGSATINAKWFGPFWDLGAVCIPDHRIGFMSPEGEERDGNIAGNVFAYLGPHQDRFIAEFSEFGPVVKRVDVGVRALREAVSA